ncbi:MAG: sigma-70 family RNA polymerase sigma factor [Verrucomicrobia bacterium]|nr:sigma-70 family RNA polymerase sigma factor [Verrucomicrobiota bacterium]
MNANERQKQLVRMLTQNQRRIFSYLYTLVPDRPAAEDLLQETCMVICEKFDEFQPETDFVAWACQIAYWEVRAARQKFSRSKVLFDDAVLEAVAKTAADMSPELNERHEALALCLEKLHPRDRELIITRYEPGGGVEAAARRTGRTVVAAYKALTRIRRLLADCVTLRLSANSIP